MTGVSRRFTLEIESVDGFCPSGERWADEKSGRGAIPVLSCEGPCIRGEIARLAANVVSKTHPYARACYAEAALVPESSMAHWVRQAPKVVVIDGCFLKCMARLMNGLVEEGRMVHVDALALHKKYSKVFLMDEVAESERKQTAQTTAERILAQLNAGQTTARDCTCGCQG